MQSRTQGVDTIPLRTPTLTLMHMLAYVVHMQARLPLARGYGPLLCKFVHW